MYLLVWKKPDGEIYCRLLKYMYDYKIGYKNRYSHELIFISNLNEYMYVTKVSIFKRILRKTINVLQKIERL